MQVRLRHSVGTEGELLRLYHLPDRRTAAAEGAAPAACPPHRARTVRAVRCWLLTALTRARSRGDLSSAAGLQRDPDPRARPVVWGSPCCTLQPIKLSKKEPSTTSTNICHLQCSLDICGSMASCLVCLWSGVLESGSRDGGEERCGEGINPLDYTNFFYFLMAEVTLSSLLMIFTVNPNLKRDSFDKEIK